MLRWNDALRTLDLGVHDLLDGVEARWGLPMSVRARAAAGQRVHREVATREAWEAEVPLRHRVVVRDWTCTIHGRVDGLDESGGRVVIEEVKSTGLFGEALDATERFPRWERQLALYVWFAAAAKMNQPVGRLRVVSLVDGSQRLFHLEPDPEIGHWLAAELDRLVRVREERLAWRTRRVGAPVHFAHETPREGQQTLAAGAEAACRESRVLLVTAPTGMGKTAAALLGVLRAARDLDLRVFWATSRTTQQPLVEATLRAVVERGTPLRTVTLRAREKACIRCATGDCPGEPGDPMPVLAWGVVSADQIAEEAGRQNACPYELARLAALGADVVVGDVNYAFDPGVRMGGLFDDGEWVAVVDEAHQLPDRAMGWGSPGIATATCDAVSGEGREAFSALAREVRDAIEESGEDAATPVVEPSIRRWRDLRDRIDEIAVDHALLPLIDGDAWPTFARDVFRFVDVLERAGDETVAIAEGGSLRLLCRDPSRILAVRFGALHASICLSATLHPTWWFRARCGLADADELPIPSPFPAENRCSLLVRGVSTAYKHRDRDRRPIAEIIDRTAAAIPGNVAIFFGSFDVMAELLAVADLTGRERLVQSPAMGESERGQLLARMHEPGPKALCAVLGGIFAEGIDLPGEALSAAIIVGPALPPPSLDRALLQAYYEQRWDDGFELAFVHPGMTKVVQAAGRVIRGPADRGLVALVCQRFLRRQFRDYLPSEWSPLPTNRPWEEAERFFRDSG